MLACCCHTLLIALLKVYAVRLKPLEAVLGYQAQTLCAEGVANNAHVVAMRL